VASEAAVPASSKNAASAATTPRRDRTNRLAVSLDSRSFISLLQFTTPVMRRRLRADKLAPDRSPDASLPRRFTDIEREHVDVLIVGGGLSGVGAAYHLQDKCPGKSYAILEARGSVGGTWDLFRYPGIRSDSDMYTLGYSFKPWRAANAIADGPSILDYIRETAHENGIDEHVRLHHRVVRADFSTPEAHWNVEALRIDTGEAVHLSSDFLMLCCGYYNYDAGYTPPLPGIERFRGQIVHPQQWTDEIDYAGKRVVVIGSGATAVTLVPALAKRASHVTMLQRSPSYVISLPGTDAIANFLRERLPAKLAYPLVRWKNVLLTMLSFQASRRRPSVVKKLIRRGAIKELPSGYDVDTHFNPTYNPWDQRLCIVPDGDLFRAIRSGRATVLTDAVTTFTETGLELASGTELQADVVVTATGLRLLAFGGAQLAVDGADVELPKTMTYKGMMLGGVPNMAFAFGYTNASWTLKCDLTCAWVCRLLRHMDEHGHDQCVAINRDASITEQPLIDFSSGYVLRSVADFPRQGSRAPWRQLQNYVLDVFTLRLSRIDDGVIEFSRRGDATRTAAGGGRIAA
jgi:monooxygenase